MLSARIKHYLAFACVALAVTGTCAPAYAGAFNVKPIRVFLNKDTGSTVLTIENQAPNVLRLQVRAYAWTNDRHGQPVLVPSDDLIVFPTLVDVMPMEHRSIRIGFSGNAAGKELSYRIALDEMPSVESQLGRNKQPGLEVRTRVTVPVFFSPLISSPKAEISDISMDRSLVHATFANDGNVHATVAGVDIVGRDAAGAKVVEKQINGWYVLPGQDWDFQTSLGSRCSKVKSISVSVQSDIGRFTRTVAASPAACK